MQEFRRAAKKLICKKKSESIDIKPLKVLRCSSLSFTHDPVHLLAKLATFEHHILVRMSVFCLVFLPAKSAALTWVPTIQWLSVYCSMSGTPDSHPESEKPLLVESRIWEFFLGFLLVEFQFEGFGICHPAWIIRDPANDWNPESKFHWQGIRTSIVWNSEATPTTVGNRESWTGLDYLAWDWLTQMNQGKPTKVSS